jgi:excisionase family DNA binding protein
MPHAETPDAGFREREAARLLGMTVREAARYLRVSPEKIRGWIRAGRLGAINTAEARCGKARFVILPDHLDRFIKSRQAGPPPKPARRKKRAYQTDFFPD